MNTPDPSAEFGKTLIIQAGIIFGILLIVGFVSLLHEIWDRKGFKKWLAILAVAMVAALVGGLIWFPYKVYIVLPWLFGSVGWLLWDTVNFYRGIAALPAEVRITLPYNPPTIPFMSKGAKWALILVCTVLGLHTLDKEAQRIREGTENSAVVQKELKQKITGIEGKLTQVAQIQKEDMDTSIKIRKKLLKNDSLALVKLKNLELMPAIALKVADKKARRESRPSGRVYSTSFTPIPAKPLSVSQPSSLTAHIPSAPEPKKEPTWFQKWWPFSELRNRAEPGTLYLSDEPTTVLTSNPE